MNSLSAITRQNIEASRKSKEAEAKALSPQDKAKALQAEIKVNRDKKAANDKRSAEIDAAAKAGASKLAA